MEAQPPVHAKDFDHQPVMLNEIIDAIQGIPDGLFLDATLGGAGHSEAILDRYPKLNVLGVDVDTHAIGFAKEKLAKFSDRVTIIQKRFDQITEAVPDNTELSGFLFDLGVSSPQLDRAERGFSYRSDGPLDMRMDPDGIISADDIVNGLDPQVLSRIIKDNSDEKFASRIAKKIVDSRPIANTSHLAEVIVAAIPAAARRTGGHPAKRTFQAIRIEVNGELKVLEPAFAVGFKSSKSWR